MQKYPGLGKLLSLATYPGAGSGTQPEPVYPIDAEIPDTEYSMWDSVNANRNTTITIKCTDGLTTDLEIELASDPTFGDAFVLDSIAATADTLAVWTTQDALNGCIRINNTSGETLYGVFINGEVATFG